MRAEEEAQSAIMREQDAKIRIQVRVYKHHSHAALSFSCQLLRLDVEHACLKATPCESGKGARGDESRG